MCRLFVGINQGMQRGFITDCSTNKRTVTSVRTQEQTNFKFFALVASYFDDSI